MERIRQPLRICAYQMILWKENLRIYIVLASLFIFLTTYLIPVRNFMVSVNEKATPFIFPFLFGNGFLSSILMIGIVLLFCNAPFYDKNQLFIIMRTGKHVWAVGQVLYIIGTSIIYVMSLLLMSIAILVPYISFENAWGRIWTTLALTDARMQFMVPFPVDYGIMAEYPPLDAVLILCGMGILVCSLLGFLIWVLNLYAGRIFSMTAAMAVILVTTRVSHLPDWARYIAPVSWMNLGNISTYAGHGITLEKAFLMLAAGNAMLMALGVYRTSRTDIGR